MRIALVVLMVLASLSTVGVGGLAAMSGYGSQAAEAAKAVEEDRQIRGSEHPEVIAAKAALSGFRVSGAGGLVVAALALALPVLAFLKRGRPLAVATAATVAAAVAFVALSPGLDVGSRAGPRTQALVYGLAGVVSAALAIAAEQVRRRRAAGAAESPPEPAVEA